jgi:hypothetical protein
MTTAGRYLMGLIKADRARNEATVRFKLHGNRDAAEMGWGNVSRDEFRTDTRRILPRSTKRTARNVELSQVPGVQGAMMTE